MKVFLNLSNHPLADWSPEQLSAAKAYGDVVDYPFPAVDPLWDEHEISHVADEIAEDVISQYRGHDLSIHLMGEFTLCFSLLRKFQTKGISCYASTSNRMVDTPQPGIKNVVFKFVRFRKYQSYQ